MVNNPVCIDLDGVLADFVQGALELHNCQSPWNDPNNYGKGDMPKLLGISRNKFFKDMGREWFANLRPFPYLKKLLSYFDGYTIVTSHVATVGCVPGKKDWIKKWLGRVPDVHTAWKSECCWPGRILIDDRAKNCEYWREAGGYAFLWPQLWNKAYEDVDCRFKKLEEFLDNVNFR